MINLQAQITLAFISHFSAYIVILPPEPEGGYPRNTQETYPHIIFHWCKSKYECSFASGHVVVLVWVPKPDWSSSAYIQYPISAHLEGIRQHWVKILYGSWSSIHKNMIWHKWDGPRCLTGFIIVECMLRILIDIDLELKSHCPIVELVEASGDQRGVSILWPYI